MIKFRKKQVLSEGTKTIDSIIVWFKAMFIGFVLAFLSLCFVGFIAISHSNSQRDHDKTQDAKQLADRINEGCHNYNRDKTISRIAAHENVFALSKLTGRTVDENTLTDDEKVKLAEYDARIAQLFAYRHCDPVCAVSYTNKDIPDCPPSDNEDGT